MRRSSQVSSVQPWHCSSAENEANSNDKRILPVSSSCIIDEIEAIDGTRDRTLNARPRR
jgi:hypothetical protein